MLAVDINFVAIIVGAISNMIIGAVWYSPLVFGKQWMKLSGISQKDIDAQKSQMSKTYAMSFVGALIMAYILAVVLDLVGVATIAQGLQIGFLIWLGFVATTTLSSVLFENKRTELYLLNNGYNLISTLVMAGILTILP